MIQIEHLSKGFGEKEALKDVSLTVEDGMIYGLIGRNGAGKTTLITIVAGLQKGEGNCLVEGLTPKQAREQKLVGYLPDVPAFYDCFTAGEYLDFLFMGKEPQRKKELLELVRLTGKERIRAMSRGMRQRLGVAATLVKDPPVVLLDEPTSALDPQGRHELSQILLELRAQKKSVILSTHILTDMERLCDRVGFLSGGVIAKSLCPGQAMDGGALRIAFAAPVGTDALADPLLEVTAEAPEVLIVKFRGEPVAAQKRLFALLSGIGVPVCAVDTQRVSLDAVFQEVCV